MQIATDFQYLSIIYKQIFQKITSTICTLMVFIKKQKSTIYIHKITKTTIFISNLKFLPTNLHLKQVFSQQSTILNDLKSCIQTTIILLFQSTICTQYSGQIYNLQNTPPPPLPHPYYNLQFAGSLQKIIVSYKLLRNEKLFFQIFQN